MKKRLPYLSALFILTLLLNSACKKEDSPVLRNYDDVKADFAAISTTEGTHDESLEYLNGMTWDFRMIAPPIISGQKYPVIIDLHGASGGAADAHQKTDCYIEPAFADMEVFIISPNGGNELWDASRNQEMVINLLFLANEFWPIDTTRVVVTGYSNGGNGSWFFGETQPIIFSAAIPMASSYSTEHPDGSFRLMPIPMYVIHGENDELFPVEDTQNWVDETNAVGSDVTLVVAPGLSHNEPCSYVPYLQGAKNWLVSEVW